MICVWGEHVIVRNPAHMAVTRQPLVLVLPFYLSEKSLLHPQTLRDSLLNRQAPHRSTGLQICTLVPDLPQFWEPELSFPKLPRFTHCHLPSLKKRSLFTQLPSWP